jgi:uncharacterized membrane protein
MEGEGLIELKETALIRKYPDGKTRISRDVDVEEKEQKVGHLVGLLTAAVTGTMPFVMLGTLAGRLLGRETDHGITNKFIKDVTKELKPRTSVLILLARSDEERRKKVMERLAPSNSKILESDLPPELEQDINNAAQKARAAGQ